VIPWEGLATECEAALVAAYVVLLSDSPLKYENKYLFVEPNGNVSNYWIYLDSTPTLQKPLYVYLVLEDSRATPKKPDIFGVIPLLMPFLLTLTIPSFHKVYWNGHFRSYQTTLPG
jgi:hypothetical protein